MSVLNIFNDYAFPKLINHNIHKEINKIFILHDDKSHMNHGLPTSTRGFFLTARYRLISKSEKNRYSDVKLIHIISHRRPFNSMQDPRVISRRAKIS